MIETSDRFIPYSRSTVAASAAEAQLADILWLFKGCENVARLKWLCEVTGHCEREVKKLIEQLRVTHRCPIGASRGKNCGYFWMVDAEDFRVGLASYWAQMLTGWRVLRTLDDPARLRELLGQLKLEA